MRPDKPIYTEKTACQDCYKCVRQCPVKAIQIKDHRATVLSDDCIFCGTCVNICPVGAKKSREDRWRLFPKADLETIRIASVAPSWTTEFPHLTGSQLIYLLKQLGFDEVSETALGADYLSAEIARQLHRSPHQPQISTACPSAVLWIQKHLPNHATFLSPLLSPLLTHARLLQSYCNKPVEVVFFGPCIAKKIEADEHPELLVAALTFDELKEWMAQNRLSLTSLPASDEVQEQFFPVASKQGVLYPMDGGMIRSIQSCSPPDNAVMMSFSGSDGLERALAMLEQETFDHPLFVELLACRGGCIQGPACRQNASEIRKRIQVETQLTLERTSAPDLEAVALDISQAYPPIRRKVATFTDVEIRHALFSIGKHSHRDELNCDGCGYNSCRRFVVALLEGRAEAAMCVSWMRQLASKKAVALMNAMPAGVAIIGSSLRIVENNRRFAELMGGQWETVMENVGSLEGIHLQKLGDLMEICSSVLRLDEPVQRQIMIAERILHLHLFPIESHQLLGLILQDITEPAYKKEQIIQKTQAVIDKHLSTVQQIACLLGENAAESEVLLNSIIEIYSAEKGNRS